MTLSAVHCTSPRSASYAISSERRTFARATAYVPHPSLANPPHQLTHAQVLEIGSGWGALAIRIASSIPDTTVDTLTLSVQQAELARERIHAVGLADTAKKGARGRVRVHLMDYRNMPPEWEGKFDRVVSVEMVEAVGQEYLEVRTRTCVPRCVCCVVMPCFGVHALSLITWSLLSIDLLQEDRLGAEEGHGCWCHTGHHNTRSA